MCGSVGFVCACVGVLCISYISCVLVFVSVYFVCACVCLFDGHRHTETHMMHIQKHINVTTQTEKNTCMTQRTYGHGHTQTHT